jgi:transcriptional regulator with XRE-family HTH domain
MSRDCIVPLVSGQVKGQKAAFEPNRLREAAEDKFLSLADLARDLGVAEKSVYRWNLGRTPPRLAHVRQIAARLDREPAWFYGKEAA